MAKKGSFSKVYDKNGDYVDVEAARFDGTRTFQMQGDVSATQTWNGDSASALTLNTSIGAKKVTTDKINDKAVQTGQIDDGAVGLTQIATNAMNGTVQDNDSKLATHAAVKTYVDSQISGQGTYLGKHTVAEINAMVTDNLHNGDRVMTSDSGTINLGPGGVGFDVEAGEDLILYKSGSTVQWDSMDGNFKTKQTAVSDPTASGTGLTFIDSASQDENGEMTLSKKTVQDGTTSQKGVVQLEDSHSSTSTTKAATPNSVKEAYDLANTANTGAVKNVAYDSTNKKITKTINGTTSDVVSVATLKTDMALNNVDNTSDANKPVSTAQQAALDLKLDKTGDGKDVTATFTEASTRANIGTGEKLSVIFGKIKKWFSDLGTAAFKNVPASGDASSTEVVLGSDTRLSAGASAVQDVTVDGASVVNSSTKVAAVPNASTSAKGAVQLAGSIGATVASENNKAATEKAVRDAINALDAEVTSTDGTNVQVKVTEADGKISAVNVTTDNTENKNNKVSSWQSTPDNTHYPSEKLVKVSLDGKVDIANIDLDSKTTTILAEVQALAQKGIHYARFYTRGDGGAANISDKPVSGSGFLCEVVCNRYAGTTNYRYLVTCWVGTDKNPYWTYVVSSTYLITWSRLNAYVPGTPKNNNLVAMDANGLVKDSGLTKSSVESAITSAGSAIQGVKVNNTTLTPDANKVVTVPLATTSADGAMSTADKTKLNGIAEGAEVNVQADWDETNSSADDFLKNKPYYTNNAQSTYFKVCAFLKTGTDGEQSDGLEILARYYQGAVHGRLLYKAGFTLYYEKVGNVSANNQYFKFHWKENGDYIDVYAQRTGYSILHAAPLVNQPKYNVDFTNFGTAVTSLPEGATEITPVWVANSASSSGTAPVKVDAYGALTPVPMDSTPTESSTNLMTSGDIFNALKPETPFNGYKQISFDSTVTFADFCAGSSNANSLAYKAFGSGFDTTEKTVDAIFRLDLTNNSAIKTGLGGISDSYPLAHVVAVRQAGFVEFTAIKSTSPLSHRIFRMRFNRYGELTQFKELVKGSGAATGSTSVPVYVKDDGDLATCTDDFVHDGDVAQTYSSSSTAPISGAGVASAISGRMPFVEVNNKDAENPLNANDFRTTGFYHFGGGVVDSVINIPDVVAGHFILEVLNHRGRVYQRFIAGEGLTEPGYVYSRVSKGTSSTSWQPWTKEIRGSDVASTYSATGTDPVNGTAVAAAIATSLTDVSYVAAQSGGGGNLNKTKNGSTTSVLAFMTTAEAQLLWTNAKANAS